MKAWKKSATPAKTITTKSVEPITVEPVERNVDENLPQAILTNAVAEIGGESRAGQQIMVTEVERTLTNGEHLLVQAGTGTGKSLGYLAPVLATLAADADARVVIATATLALQTQLANKDIPTAVAAGREVTGKTIAAAVVKGRSNYACLYRIRAVQGTAQEALVGGVELVVAAAESPSTLGAEVVMLREWAEEEAATGGVGDRDDAPAHSLSAWAQVSVPVWECLGAVNCPYGVECFVERSREVARRSQLIVTNHALLAINALHGGAALPSFNALIVDEAHELVSRVTSVASHELSPQLVERVARRCLPWLSDDVGIDMLDAADALAQALDEAELARVLATDSKLVTALARVRDSARAVVSGLESAEDDNDRRQAAGAAREVFETAEIMAALKDGDVIWVSERERFGRQVVQSPLNVAGLMQELIFAETPTVLTSATLKIGGEFSSVARQVGMSDDWRGVDVGSPFDYAQQGILYIATQLPPPSRDGISEAVLAQIAELVWAAGGRTLGLFASQRSAEVAAQYCRAEVPNVKILCQGQAQLSELTKQFVESPEVCLFGTLSLWQGVDLPGDTCELVLIDKIPFPRPDDPLMQARQQAVAEAGGNGFMAVAATHAGLLLAQGSGRLIRTSTDRGVVAVLDPRLATARYGAFLRASIPDFWMTTDSEVAIGALRRLRNGDE